MSEMVETVAMALCAADDEPWDELPEDSNGQLISFAGDRKYYRFQARAAIAAMREPTEEMIMASHFSGPDRYQPDGVIEAVWPAMIDEALK